MDVMGQKHSYIPDDYYIIKNNIKSKTKKTIKIVVYNKKSM